MESKRAEALKNSGLKNQQEHIEEEMHERERFQYRNKKYLDSMQKMPVVVTSSSDVINLDMQPRVNIIEDL